MLRTEIQEQDKWDLTTIYATTEDWEKAVAEAQARIPCFPELLPEMLSSPEALFRTVEALVKLEASVQKIYTYANLRYSEDTSDNTARQLMGRAQDLSTALAEATSGFDTALLSLTPEMLAQFTEDYPPLRAYEILLRNMLRFHPHTLSAPEEALLAAFEKERSTASETYETMTASDLRFGKTLDEDGKEIELTDTLYARLVRSEKRAVRKAAFETLYAGYERFRNTFASLYAGQIETEKVCAKVRHYGSALEHSLFFDHVTPEIYRNIVKNVSSHLDVLFRYYRLKKKVLGLEELHMYDIYVPLSQQSRQHYTYAEAKEEVLAACGIFGEEYVNTLRKGYESRWVDVYPNTGKVGGAFSGGCAGTEPFILLNFQGLDEDVSTLAHESGHSMHSWYTRKNNPLQYADYSIFVAEVPSTVNELLLAYHKLEHTTDRAERLSILGGLLELYKGTIFRQVMFAEFEDEMHTLSENGEILTADLLCEKYYALNQKYFGNEVVLDKQIASEWMRIPHFYYGFYVYKYAIGLTAASHIVRRLRAHEPGALDAYLRFLKLGSTQTPIASLKIAGVDMTGTEAFDSAVETFGELIDEFEALL